MRIYGIIAINGNEVSVLENGYATSERAELALSRLGQTLEEKEIQAHIFSMELSPIELSAEISKSLFGKRFR